MSAPWPEPVPTNFCYRHAMQHPMNYCPDCAAPMHLAIPDGDDRERNVCTACGNIVYQNPRNVVGCVVDFEGRILLCKRAIAPRLGFWTLPAGFLELGETMAQGAARETREEACAQAQIDGLFTQLDIPQIGQIHLFYHAHMAAPEFAAGPESQAVALVAEQDIPWQQLAFPSVHRTLQLYCADRAAGQFTRHEEIIEQGAWQRLGLDRTPDESMLLES